MHKAMTQAAAASFQNLPSEETHQFLAELMDDPPNFEFIMESYTGRVISHLAYGGAAHTEPIRTHSHALLNAISPAAHFTNIIPQLAKLPEWISPWKRQERARHDRERDFFLRTFQSVEKEVAAGPTPASLMKTFFESRKQPKRDLRDDTEGAYVVGMLGLAGLLTTASSLMTYILAMCLHPEWQDKLQEEIDRVCGDRLPETSDAPNLPVLRAVIKEIMRWRPVVPSSKSSKKTPRSLLLRLQGTLDCGRADLLKRYPA